MVIANATKELEHQEHLTALSNAHMERSLMNMDIASTENLTSGTL